MIRRKEAEEELEGRRYQDSIGEEDTQSRRMRALWAIKAED